jgi:hypothetical protein
MVAIGNVKAIRRDKMLARHFVHGTQYGLVTDPAPAERKHEFHASDPLRILR